MIVIDDSYRNKLFLYLNSFDEDVERDLLEVDVYDQDYMTECYKIFYVQKEQFYEQCKQENRQDLCLRYPFDWYSVISETYFLEMVKIYGSVEFMPDHIQHPIKAYLKFEKNHIVDFGKVVGRSVDRYDYFMYLKYGITYKPKYITKEELYKILKINKYGYSAHCIF